MNYEVRLSTIADSDLRSIFEYIAFDLKSVQNAKGQIDRLEKGISSLAQMPERFRIYEKEPWQSRNLRVMPIDNYLVFYIPDCLSRIVTVLRGMYGGRDVDKQLDSNLD